LVFVWFFVLPLYGGDGNPNGAEISA
jgi:hypothetical protein